MGLSKKVAGQSCERGSSAYCENTATRLTNRIRQHKQSWNKLNYYARIWPRKKVILNVVSFSMATEIRFRELRHVLGNRFTMASPLRIHAHLRRPRLRDIWHYCNCEDLL